MAEENMVTRTTFIRHRDRKVFAEYDLFAFLNDWMQGYAGWGTYDAVTDKQKHGGLLPALTWGQRKAGATGRRGVDMEYINSYVVLDYDACDLEPEEFGDCIADTGYRIFWHETLSSGKVVDGRPIYKYHAFIETNSIITDMELFTKHRHALLERVGQDIGVEGHDPACKDIARIMYLPVRSLKSDCEWGMTGGDSYPIIEVLDSIVAESPTVAPTPPIKDNGMGDAPDFMSGGVGQYNQAMPQAAPGVVSASSDPSHVDLMALPFDKRYEMVKRLLDGISYTTGENEKWTGVCYSVYSLLGEQGRSLFTWWHQTKCPEYHPEQEQAVWSGASQYAPSYKGGSLHQLADDSVTQSVMRDTGRINRKGAVAQGGGDQQWGQGETVITIPTADNLSDFIAWDSYMDETHVSVAPETRKGVGTGIRALDEQIGVWARMEKEHASEEGVDSWGVLPTTSSLLVGAATGVGKTTAMCNLILGMVNKNNQPLGIKKNAIVFSLEGGASMYTDTLLGISQRRCVGNADVKARLDAFHKEHGWWKLEPDKDGALFSNPDTIEKYRYREFKNQYNNKAMRELTDMLIKSNPDLGRITITNTFESMYPEQIITQVESIEKLLGIEYDIIVVDYIQALKFDSTKGIGEIHGFMESTKTLMDWCNGSDRIPLFATQLVNYNAPEHNKPLFLNSIAQSKNISTMFSHVLLLQQAKYDRHYYNSKHLPASGWDDIKDEHLKRIGVLRVNVAKSRTGGTTMANTECLIGVCQDTYAFTDHVIDADVVIKGDEDYKDGKTKTKPQSGGGTAVGRD